MSKGCKFLEPQQIVITTDASLLGWGAHLGSHMTQGHWSLQEQSLSINILKLRAVYLALLSFKRHVLGRDVLILTDNISAKAHINRLGGTRSKALMQESLRLGLWAEAHLTSLRADYIAGMENVCADSLSRNLIDQAEWNLPLLLFN